MHEEEYKGRIITVNTFKIGKGCNWIYQIDGGPIRRGNDHPLRSEELMRNEAFGEAKAEIDRMA